MIEFIALWLPQQYRHISCTCVSVRGVNVDRVQYSFRMGMAGKNITASHNDSPMNELCGNCEGFNFNMGSIHCRHFTSCCHNGLIYLPQTQVNKPKQLIVTQLTNHFYY
jgi:hypothetical protein